MVWKVGYERPELNSVFVSKTIKLESGRGKRNSECRGAIRRYSEEHQKRRQLIGTVLTLMNESVGSEKD